MWTFWTVSNIKDHWPGPDMLLDISDETKFQGHLAWTKCVHGCSVQNQIATNEGEVAIFFFLTEVKKAGFSEEHFKNII